MIWNTETREQELSLIHSLKSLVRNGNWLKRLILLRKAQKQKVDAMNFATLEDVNILFRRLNGDEVAKAEELLSVVSDTLRQEAKRVGKNLDEMSVDSSYRNVLRSVTVDVVARNLMTSTDSEPMTQESQSALGYTWTGTYLSPGGGLFIKDSELKRLGLKKQRYGALNLYG